MKPSSFKKLISKHASTLWSTLGLGIFWGWMSLQFFSLTLQRYSVNPIGNIEFTNCVSLAVSVACAAAILFLPRPTVGKQRPVPWFTLIAVPLSGGIGSLLCLFASSNHMVLFLSSVLCGITMTLLLYMFFKRIAQHEADIHTIVKQFCIALIISTAVYLAVYLMDGFLAIATCVSLPILSALCLYMQIKVHIRQDKWSDEKNERANKKGSTIIRSIRALPWKMLVGLSVFGLVFGLMREPGNASNLDSFLSAYLLHSLARAATAVIVLIVIALFKKQYWVLNTIGLVALVVGFSLYWVPTEAFLTLYVAAVTVGFTCYELLSRILLFELYQETKLRWNHLFGIVFGTMAIATSAGTFFVYLWANHSSSPLPNSMFLILIVVMIIVSSSLMNTHNIASFWNRPKQMIPEIDKDKQVINGLLEEQYKLTPREIEVANLLLRGRSEPFIASALYITAGTVHSHVMHIYAKVQVRSKQELMTIIEEHTNPNR